ncbi:VOC family protein [Caenimonas koreensis]|uniref:VOC family protein n=1 Tax=Caenimonas koreensis DSM 17982 TaxID=1121255 RepID=A0A844AX83_9BURK|nr:VOC family protein [Caenimonas koreensis]MRD45692.1 VOC family protein [Caenimonas koreensis DSM 17982]
MDPVVHFEMPYRDRDRMAAFYSKAFGWTMQMLGAEMGNYAVATTAVSDAIPDGYRGVINGGFFERKDDWPDQYPSVVIAVKDVRAKMKEITAAGGEVLGEPMMIPGVGDYVSFRDTEGNRVSILQALPQGR